MTARWAVNANQRIRATADIMTARHLRHLPVADDVGLLAVVGVTGACWGLTNPGEG